MVQGEVKVRRQAAGAAEKARPQVNADDARAYIEAQLMGLVDQMQAGVPEVARPEEAEPLFWWDLIVFGPFQFPPAIQPSGVMEVGESALIATLAVLNPLPVLLGGVSPQDVIEGFAPTLEINYRTGNISTWTLAEPGLQIDSPIALCSGCGIGPFYLDLQVITPTIAGVHDMSVSARITGGPPLGSASFGGLATQLFHTSFEPLLTLFGFPGSTPGFLTKAPLRFNVYIPA
jgi:hypothetical protein